MRRLAISIAFALTAGAALASFRLVWDGRRIFDAELPFPSGMTFLPNGHYATEVKSLPATLDIVDGSGVVRASFSAPTNVLPPFTFHVALSCAHPSSLFVTKDGVTRVVDVPPPPMAFDFRTSSNLKGLRVRPAGGAGAVTATQSAGVGQADVRFVTDGRSCVPYVEDGRLLFTFSARYFGAHLGVGSIEIEHPERGWRFEGTILFDSGDGKLRNDVAAHIWRDVGSGEWRAYVSNFSTSSAIDGLGGRAKGGINVAWSKECPLKGFHVMSARTLDLDGMAEDPCGYYDAAEGKWRLFVSQFTSKGIRACLLESDRWDGGFRLLSGCVSEDSTGTTIALVDGRPRCLSGSVDRTYYAYAYPSLEKLGMISLDVKPWGEKSGWPHGRGWPAYAEVRLQNGLRRKIFLTMDRENFPGMPQPNWTYGRLFIYADDEAKVGVGLSY